MKIVAEINGGSVLATANACLAWQKRRRSGNTRVPMAVVRPMTGIAQLQQPRLYQTPVRIAERSSFYWRIVAEINGSRRQRKTADARLAWTNRKHKMIGPIRAQNAVWSSFMAMAVILQKQKKEATREAGADAALAPKQGAAGNDSINEFGRKCCVSPAVYIYQGILA